MAVNRSVTTNRDEEFMYDHGGGFSCYGKAVSCLSIVRGMTSLKDSLPPEHETQGVILLYERSALRGYQEATFCA